MYDKTKYDDRSVLEIPGMIGIGPSIGRNAQAARKWPEGQVIVSADSHILCVNIQDFVEIWAMLTFGRVFDRHPKLRVVFVEAGIGWVPKALQDADNLYNSQDPFIDQRTLHHPSWYWGNHCHATFMVDAVGPDQLSRIGPDRVMWSSDYPHSEGSFGYTQESIAAVFKATSHENAQNILGKTAPTLFNMN